MNDRFLFRGWLIDRKRMFYPQAHNERGKNQEMVELRVFFRQLSHYGESELMQCTGLKDKNGKLIYEFDVAVLRNYHDGQELGKVIWYNSGWVVDATDGFHIFLPAAIDNFKCEIIGNIYENPELLK